MGNSMGSGRAGDGGHGGAATRRAVLGRVLVGGGLVLLLGAQGAPGGAGFLYVNAAIDAVNRFFKTLAADGPATAYADASVQFRASTSLTAFEQTAARLRLRDYDGVRWLTWSRDGEAAHLSGRLDLGDAGDVTATMVVVKDAAGAWRLASLEMTPLAGR